MKKNKSIILLILITLCSYSYSQLTFKSLQELNEYAYQNSELGELTNGYFLDFINDFRPSRKDSMMQYINETRRNVTSENIYSFLDLLQVADVSQDFKSDSLIYPIYNDLMSNDGHRQINIPLFIGDVEVDFLTENAYNQFQNWESESPYPALNENQLNRERVAIVGLLLDSLYNNNIHVYWDDNTVVSNTDRQITAVTLHIGENSINIGKSEKVDLSPYYSTKSAISSLTVEVEFSDNSRIISTSKCFYTSPTNLPEKIYIDDQAKSTSPLWDQLGGVDKFFPFGEDPELQFSVLWGCGNENKLKKPYIFVTGYGPYMENSWWRDGIINNNQGWPSTIEHAYWLFNQEGYIDELSGAGYDVIIVKFYPPNRSIVKQAEALTRLIEMINEEKFKNNSFEENIINGYSAGAMATRLALQMMEKRHLESNAPNHHTKLYVSYDGEHGGANVPLGVQHAVKHLMQYQHGFWAGSFNVALNFKMRALYYTLHDEATKELLFYHYLETGDADNPGQAPSQARLDYLQKHEDFNHQLSWRNPGYPIFTRNVSISNGISQSRINGSTSGHYPFPEEEGHTFFKHERFGRRWQAHFVAPGSNTTVFRYDERQSLKWKIVDEAKVNNPWILDNAPGGTSSMSKKQEEGDANTMYHIVDLLNKTTTFIGGNADVADFKALYSFTPTVLTHDIRNYNPFDNNGMGRMHFDMKAQGMMYQDESQVGELTEASSFYGYPHLSIHPGDISGLISQGLLYTPFDAVFSWDDVNTVHLTNREVIFDEERNKNIFGNPRGGWHEDGDNSFLRTQIRDFLIDESDYFDAYVQNRRFGENANPNHIYKADVVARNEIYVGSKVTQRTNFKRVEIQENAAVRFIACKSVTLKPGIEIKAGASFYAGVSDDNCSCGGVLGMSKNDDNTNRLSEEQYLIQEKSLQTEINDVNLLEVKLYPKPRKRRCKFGYRRCN